jgi:transposase-like protein
MDIFIACHDNLKGLGEAINAVFPKTKQQLCIVHQIRKFYSLLTSGIMPLLGRVT